jgi:hypothetical protein
MITKEYVFDGDSIPEETLERLLRKHFPDSQFLYKPYNERGSEYEILVLSMSSPYLENPVHFEFRGGFFGQDGEKRQNIGYTIYGLNEKTLAAHPQNIEIEQWLEQQVRALKRLFDCLHW